MKPKGEAEVTGLGSQRLRSRGGTGAPAGAVGGALFGCVLSMCMALRSIPNTKRDGEDHHNSWHGKAAAKLCPGCPPVSVLSSTSLTRAFMLSAPSAVRRLLSPELGMGKAGSWSYDVRETEAREEGTDPGQGKRAQEPIALKSPSMQQRAPS